MNPPRIRYLGRKTLGWIAGLIVWYIGYSIAGYVLFSSRLFDPLPRSLSFVVPLLMFIGLGYAAYQTALRVALPKGARVSVYDIFMSANLTVVVTVVGTLLFYALASYVFVPIPTPDQSFFGGYFAALVASYVGFIVTFPKMQDVNQRTSHDTTPNGSTDVQVTQADPETALTLPHTVSGETLSTAKQKPQHMRSEEMPR